MKCPSFNPDSALRMKLICGIHKEAQKEKLCANVCPCIYGLEENPDSTNQKRDLKRRCNWDREEKVAREDKSSWYF